MSNLKARSVLLGAFAFILSLCFHMNTYEAKADVQTSSQQGVVIKSTNISINKVVKIAQKETVQSSTSTTAATSNSIKQNLSRGTSTTTATASGKSSVVSKAYEFLGRPYVWGASGPKAFDCSGFTAYVYRSFGVSLPHKASSQATLGKSVSRSSLVAGDLVFFDTLGGISHVGIYIGDGQFIHASSGSNKVTVSALSNSYYSERYVTARRILN